jgi:tetratricopeptide (TPR) repeat protein
MSAQARSRTASRSGAARTQRCVATLLLAAIVGGFGGAADPRLRGADLARTLPERADLELHDGALRWQTYAVRWGIPGAYLLVNTGDADVEVAWALTDPGIEAPLAGLARQLAATPEDARLRLRFDTLLDAVVLATSSGFVQGDRVWQRDDPEPLRAAADRHFVEAVAELRSARDELDGWIEASDLGEPGRTALRETLARLDARDSESSQYPAPSALRRMVRHGWLEQLTRRDARAVRLRKAVWRASELRSVERAHAGDDTIERLADAFGHGVRTLVGPGRTRYEVALPPPAYFADAAGATLVIELAPGARPLALRPAAQAAQVFQNGVRVARWDRTTGFRAWPDGWRRRVTPPAELRDEWVLGDAIPPHVRISSALGDVQRLITAYGELVPERARTPEAREAWLRAAARALPDAAHLDLLGEFLFAYAHDSPEPRWPQLLGTPSRMGDIHQTAAQTLATETGGIYRGDCDDLSELYQEITRRQGRNAHLIGLPAHAALAWSEREADGAWRTYVLQTAPPLAVTGETLERSLEQTYRSFDADAPLHADQLEVLLRFAGDNTRDTYFLSARIFSDPQYAERMIELQENWHGWTLGRGLRSAERMAAEPGAGVAEQLELGSLLEMAGELERAVDVLGRALEQSHGPAERTEIAIQQLEALFDSGHPDRALALAQRALDEWIPELEHRRNAFELTLRTRLADALLTRGRDRAVGLDILGRRIAPVLARRSHWYRSAEERYRIEQFMELAISALHDTAESPLEQGDAWRTLARFVDQWLTGAAFLSLDASESVLKPYGLLGRYLEATQGAERYRTLVRGAEPPAEARDPTARRASGEARLDASWVGAAPHYWWRALLDLIAFDRTTLIRDEVLELAMRLRVARVRAEALGLDHPSFATYVLQSEIATALAARDSSRLRAALRSARESGDWELAKAAAFWIEEIGRRMPVEQFTRVVQDTIAELRSRPLLLQIAWRTLRAGATEHAVAAIDAIALAAPDDAVLASERAYIRALSSTRDTPGSARNEREGPIFRGSAQLF